VISQKPIFHKLLRAYLKKYCKKIAPKKSQNRQGAIFDSGTVKGTKVITLKLSHVFGQKIASDPKTYSLTFSLKGIPSLWKVFALYSLLSDPFTARKNG
jgi:hypothetical protein